MRTRISHAAVPALAAALTALLALPVAVSATPPVVETFHDEFSITFSGPCPNGVTLVGTFTEDVRVTTFFDEAGNPVRLQIAVNVASVITNPETGESAENPQHQTIFEDLVDGRD